MPPKHNLGRTASRDGGSLHQMCCAQLPLCQPVPMLGSFAHQSAAVTGPTTALLLLKLLSYDKNVPDACTSRAHAMTRPNDLLCGSRAPVKWRATLAPGCAPFVQALAAAKVHSADGQGCARTA